MYVLICEQPIVNNSCPSGFSSVLLSDITPDLMTLAELNEVAPYAAGFLALCWCWRKVNQ